MTNNFSICGPGKNLIFSEAEEYVRFEKAVFIQAINRDQPHIVNSSITD